MAENGKPVFLVDAFSDPILVRVQGRASFQNSACLRDFFNEMVGRGKRKFVVDFQHCTSMDSTFLGVLAGIALMLRRLDPHGSVVLMRVGPRNLELVYNLGLHRLLTVDEGHEPQSRGAPEAALTCPDPSEIERARLVLEAHESLVEADEANRSRFQDVLAFLRSRVTTN